MNPLQRTLVVLLAAIGLCVLAWRVVAWRTAAAEFTEARAFHAEVAGKAARIAALRARPPVSGFGARPGDDVMQLATRVFGIAGLPAERLRTVQAEPDRALADDRDGRRVATGRLTVDPVTVQELGALLAAWRSSQQVWSVARIDLGAITRGEAGARGGGGGGGGWTSGQYRASLVVTATYIDEAAPAVSSVPPSSTPSSPPLLGAAQ